MLDKVDMAFLTIDKGFRVTYANRMAAEFFGRQGASLVRVCLHDLLEACLPHTGVFDRWYDRISTSGKAGELEVPVHNFRWALFRLYPQESGMTMMIEDITHRRIREEPQRAALLTFNSLSEAVFLLYENGAIYYANDAAFSATGYTLEDLKMLRASEVIPDLDPELLMHNIGHAPGSARFESVMWPKEGDAVLVEVCVTAQKLFRKTNYIVSIRDITERKRAEVVLRESERAHAFQSAVLESVRDPVWATDPDFRIVYWNDAAAATFGWTADEVRGRHTGKLFRTVIPGSTRDDAVAQLLQTGDFRGEVVCHCKDGRQIFAEISSRVVRGPDGEAVRIVNTARDITERKRVEGALCESEARLRAVIDGAPLAIALTGPSGEILLRNPRFDQLWGRPAHVTTARTYSEVYEGYHLDGRRIESEEWPGARAVLKGEIIENEVYEIVQADGRRITCWFGSVPIRNASEEIVGALVVFRDITKERRTEEALQDAKTQAELYLDLMGHDINNMHQIAIGYLEMAQGILPDGGQSEFVDKPLEVLHRSAQLIQNVRKLQRLHEGLIQTQDVDVCQILTNVRREFGSIPRKTITLNLNGCEDCFVRANELLYDVFANLAGNAVKHTRDGADIYIDLDIIKDDSGRYCRVCVEDDGPGILDDYKDIIFNRGIKGISRETGMGLGLYLVKSLVNSYDGRVWVEDRIAGDHSKGARFVVVLPTVKD